MGIRENSDRRGFLRRAAGGAAGAGAMSSLMTGCVDPFPQGRAQRALHLDGGVGELCAPCSVHVYNVQTDFGGDAKAAAQAIPDEGGILYFPAGEYVIRPPVDVPSRTWVLGDGSGSVLKRAPGSPSSGIIQGIGSLGGEVTDVRVSHLAFDLNYDVNFVTGVKFEHAANIVVTSCTFLTSNAPPANETLHAVLARGVRGLWVSRNRLSYCQIKAAGPGGDGGPGLFISNNYISQPHNLGISVVGVNTEQSILAVAIENNLIEDPTTGDIFVGSDGEGAQVAEASRIRIVGNVIRGAWSDAAHGILVDLGQSCFDWVIHDNLLNNEASPDPNAQQHGILIKETSEETSDGGFMQSLSIQGNRIRNTHHEGIEVTGKAKAIVISGNVLEDTRGVRVAARRDGVDDCVVAGNVIEGNGQGIVLDAEIADIRSALIRDNVSKNHSVGGIVLTAAAGTSIEASLVGNQCCDSRVTGKTQSYGVVEQANGGVMDTRYVNNDLRGNLYGPASGLNAGVFVRDNRGLALENKGTAVVPTGVGSWFVDVAHGLAATPLAHDIRITAASSTSDPGLVTVSNVGPTTFRVSCAQDPGAGGFAFGWHVEVPHV